MSYHVKALLELKGVVQGFEFGVETQPLRNPLCPTAKKQMRPEITLA